MEIPSWKPSGLSLLWYFDEIVWKLREEPRASDLCRSPVNISRNEWYLTRKRSIAYHLLSLSPSRARKESFDKGAKISSIMIRSMIAIGNIWRRTCFEEEWISSGTLWYHYHYHTSPFEHPMRRFLFYFSGTIVVLYSVVQSPAPTQQCIV